MMARCPGQDRRNLKIDTYECPQCGYAVEIFSDEMKALCPRCGFCLRRKKDVSCADWCAYARECLGEKRYNERKGA